MVGEVSEVGIGAALKAQELEVDPSKISDPLHSSFHMELFYIDAKMDLWLNAPI